MPNTTFGSAARKETVYGGPGPQSQGTVYGGPAPASAGGTVYNGPSAGGTVYGGASAGTVYKPPRPSAADGSKPDVSIGASRGSKILFAIAGFSVLNTLMILGGSHTVLGIGLTLSKFSDGTSVPAVMVLNILGVGLFALLGIFARNGSAAAVMIGTLLYAGDGLLLFLTGDPAAHILGLVFHGVLIISLFKSFTQLQD